MAPLIFYYTVYGCLACMHVPWRAESVGAPGTGVREGYAPHHVGARNQTCVL